MRNSFGKSQVLTGLLAGLLSWLATSVLSATKVTTPVKAPEIWRTYRFIHIPAHSGPWKVYVQLNGWGNFGFPVTVSVDDLGCNPKPGAP